MLRGDVPIDNDDPYNADQSTGPSIRGGPHKMIVGRRGVSTKSLAVSIAGNLMSCSGGLIMSISCCKFLGEVVILETFFLSLRDESA